MLHDANLQQMRKRAVIVALLWRMLRFFGALRRGHAPERKMLRTSCSTCCFGYSLRDTIKHVAVFGNVQPNSNARRGKKIEVCYDGRLIAKHSPRTVHGKIEARQGFGKRVTAERETAAAVEEMIAVVAITDEVVFKRVAIITRKVPQRTVIIAIVRTSDVPCCMQRRRYPY